MNDGEWRGFFLAAARILGPGDVRHESPSWCSFTTFGRLEEDAGYWTFGLPAGEDIEAGWLRDGGVWGQPFRYRDIAHIILPRSFHWDVVVDGEWRSGVRTQDIRSLSGALRAEAIDHRLTELALEIKLY